MFANYGNGVDTTAINSIASNGEHNEDVSSLTVVIQVCLDTARSWICNVCTGGIRPPGVVLIGTDEESNDGLKAVSGSYAVLVYGMKGGVSGTAYCSPGYWLLMLERTQLIRDLLDNGVAVFAFETDQVSLPGSLPFVQRIVYSGDEVHSVGTLDTRHENSGNFLFFNPTLATHEISSSFLCLNPTLATRRIWSEVCKQFPRAYFTSRMDRRSATSRKYMENNQSTQTKLVLFDVGFKTANPVLFWVLDTELFVDRRWYVSDRGKYYKSHRTKSPKMVNNNCFIGIDNNK